MQGAGKCTLDEFMFCALIRAAAAGRPIHVRCNSQRSVRDTEHRRPSASLRQWSGVSDCRLSVVERCRVWRWLRRVDLVSIAKTTRAAVILTWHTDTWKLGSYRCLMQRFTTLRRMSSIEVDKTKRRHIASKIVFFIQFKKRCYAELFAAVNFDDGEICAEILRKIMYVSIEILAYLMLRSFV